MCTIVLQYTVLYLRVRSFAIQFNAELQLYTLQLYTLQLNCKVECERDTLDNHIYYVLCIQYIQYSWYNTMYHCILYCWEAYHHRQSAGGLGARLSPPQNHKILPAVLWEKDVPSKYFPDTWRIRKVIGFDKKFCTSDNQFFIKFWLLTFSTMEILNPKVGTVPRKFEKYFWLTNRLTQFLP